MGEKKRRAQFESLPPEGRLGDEPIEQTYHDKMVAMAGALDELFNGDKKGDERETGFVVLVFPFGDKSGRANYNLKRCRPPRHRGPDERNDRAV